MSMHARLLVHLFHCASNPACMVIDLESLILEVTMMMSRHMAKNQDLESEECCPKVCFCGRSTLERGSAMLLAGISSEGIHDESRFGDVPLLLRGSLRLDNTARKGGHRHFVHVWVGCTRLEVTKNMCLKLITVAIDGVLLRVVGQVKWLNRPPDLPNVGVLKRVTPSPRSAVGSSSSPTLKHECRSLNVICICS